MTTEPAPTPPTEEPRDESISDRSDNSDEWVDELVNGPEAWSIKEALADHRAAYERVVAERDLRDQQMNTLAGIYEATRKQMCGMCRSGICSKHQPAPGIADSVQREAKRLLAADAERDRLRSDLNLAADLVTALVRADNNRTGKGPGGRITGADTLPLQQLLGLALTLREPFGDLGPSSSEGNTSA